MTRGRYNPKASLLGDAIKHATISDEPMRVGEEVMFVGLSKIDAAALPVFQPCVVREMANVDAALPSIPRYRAVNGTRLSCSHSRHATTLDSRCPPP